MDVTYGADYSGGELSPAELDRFTTYDLRFLLRYIGWPDNPKCISHYPGAYQKLAGSGRAVLLVAQQGTADPAGGHDAGVAMAQRALDDAASVGYPDTLPIFFCAGGWLSLSGIRWTPPCPTSMARRRCWASTGSAPMGSGTSFRRPRRAGTPSGGGCAGRRRTMVNWPRAGRTSTGGMAPISTRAAGSAEPGWIYGMVIGILGAALLALVAAMVIASLTGSRVVPTDVASATTLILGGLIGILAPTPASKKGSGSGAKPPAS